MKMPEKNTMLFLMIKSIMVVSGFVLSYSLFNGAVYIVAIFMAILLPVLLLHPEHLKVFKKYKNVSLKELRDVFMSREILIAFAGIGLGMYLMHLTSLAIIAISGSKVDLIFPFVIALAGLNAKLSVKTQNIQSHN